jgi:hypothetical protein
MHDMTIRSVRRDGDGSRCGIMQERSLMRFAVFVVCVVSLPHLAFADEVASTQIARARFTTDAEPDVVEHAACGLDAKVEVAGQSRALDVRVVTGVRVMRCSTSQNGLVLTVQTTDAHDVNVEVEVPDGSPPETAHELSNLVQAVGAELRRRSTVAQAAQAPLRKVAFSPAMTASGIALGVAGVAAFAVGYVWLLTEIGNVPCAQEGRVCIDAGPPTLMIAGVGAIPLAALLAIVGERRVPEQTARLVPWVAPRVGGAAAGLSLMF